MKKTWFTALLASALFIAGAGTLSAEAWNKGIVQYAADEYDLHLTMNKEVKDMPFEQYEKELLLFISDKSVKEGFEFFTFDIDATNVDVVIVHVKNFKTDPRGENLQQRCFVAKEVLGNNAAQ